MATEIVLRVRPEEEDFRRKREQLAHLQAELVERELFLTNLRSEVSRFESVYLHKVKALYAELDEWNTRIAGLLTQEEALNYAELQARLSELLREPQKLNSQENGTEGRSSSGGQRKQPDEFETGFEAYAAIGELVPNADLKAVYREVAKRVHPDLACDERDRRERERLMREANAAYERGDLDGLQKILEECKNSTQFVRGGGIRTDLAFTTWQIAQIKARLMQIEKEIEALLCSDIGRLKARAEALRAEGRDLLTEMVEGIRERIDSARCRFYRLSDAEGQK